MSWIITQNTRFYLHENETLLAGLLRQTANNSATDDKTTIAMPKFECCQGYCGACKMRICVLSGKVAHTLPPLCALEDNEVLACCCVVVGAVRVD